MPISFASAMPLSTDKAPNDKGQKGIAMDPTGLVADSEDAWWASAASAGALLVRLALAQQIITFDDLEGLEVGDSFTMADLVRRRRSRLSTSGPERYSAEPSSIDNMCAFCLGRLWATSAPVSEHRASYCMPDVCGWPSSPL